MRTKLNHFKKLSIAEKRVFDAIANGDAPSQDVGKLADVCHLSDLQVNIALKLLTYKDLLPHKMTD
ncbi:hypothetical protein [Paenibacillus xerothermodurans]|nr:hypothetical protein [Paenibacillus xerothermodurans]